MATTMLLEEKGALKMPISKVPAGVFLTRQHSRSPLYYVVRIKSNMVPEVIHMPSDSTRWQLPPQSAYGASPAPFSDRDEPVFVLTQELVAEWNAFRFQWSIKQLAIWRATIKLEPIVAKQIRSELAKVGFDSPQQTDFLEELSDMQSLKRRNLVPISDLAEILVNGGTMKDVEEEVRKQLTNLIAHQRKIKTKKEAIRQETAASDGESAGGPTEVVHAVLSQAKDAPAATGAELAGFMARYAKIINDVLPKAGIPGKECGPLVLKWLLKRSGKPKPNKISAAVLEQLLLELEAVAGSPVQVVTILKA